MALSLYRNDTPPERIVLKTKPEPWFHGCIHTLTWATTYLTNHIIQRYARVWRDRLALLVCLSLLASYAWGGVTGQGILGNSEPICHYQAQTREDSFGEQARDYNIFILNGSQFVNETGLMSRGLGWLKGCLVANAPCNNKSNF